MTCHLQTVTVSLLPFQFEFFLFIFLLWLPRPGLPKLSWLTVGTVDILVLFLILEILSFFSPVRMTLAVGLSYYTAFIMLGYVVDTTEQLNWLLKMIEIILFINFFVWIYLINIIMVFIIDAWLIYIVTYICLPLFMTCFFGITTHFYLLCYQIYFFESGKNMKTVTLQANNNFGSESLIFEISMVFSIIRRVPSQKWLEW